MATSIMSMFTWRGIFQRCALRCREKIPRLSKKMIRIYVVIFLISFSNGFSVIMLFPFVPFMVESLLPWLLENESLVATYAGIVSSSAFFGRIFSSYIWGAISDRKGRKPVLVVSMILMGITSAVFGFSVSFEMAVVVRLIAGLSNGVVGTSKAVISESSDNSNQAFGVAVLGTSWGMAIIISPAVAGAISDPIRQYNLTIDNYIARELLTKFPYSLPCLLSFALCIFTAVLSFFLLPETLGMTSNKKRSEVSQYDITRPGDDTTNDSDTASLLIGDSGVHTVDSDRINCHDQHSLEDVCSQSSLDEVTSENKGMTYNDANNDIHNQLNCQLEGHDHVEDNNVNCGITQEAVVMRKETNALKARTSMKNSIVNLLSLLCDKNVALTLLVYCIFASVDIGFNDIYSVWAKTSPHLGGLGFSLGEIGITLTASGVLLIPINLVFFPILERKFGALKSFYAVSVILIPTMMLLPNVHYLLSYNVKWLLWLMLCTVLLVIQTSLVISFNCQILFINNSVIFDKSGSVNGLGSTMTACTRAVLPLVSGGLYSLTLSETAAAIGYPFDYRLVFTIFGLLFVLCVFLVACLPVSINKQKIIEDVETTD